MTEQPPEGGDPWIEAYLSFIARLERDEFATLAQAQECAHELRRGLPGGSPGMPARLFITADIHIRFPGVQPTPGLMAALWIPHGTGNE